MNFLQAVNRVFEAAGEPTVATLATPTALTTKFMNFVNEAYRMRHGKKRWPWTRAFTTVTATADPHTFNLAAAVEDTIMVTYNGVPLADNYSYEDLVVMTAGGSVGGTPQYAAQATDGTLFLYPYPTDTTPEANISVYAYTVLTDLAADSDILGGPAVYHDVVVQIAYALAVTRHFGDETGGRKLLSDATNELKAVFSKVGQAKARPRFRT